MSASISTLPVWKKGSTPAEWLQELAAMALEHPERFARIVVVYEAVDDKNRSINTRIQHYNIDSATLELGTLQTAVLEIYEHMKGRRA